MNHKNAEASQLAAGLYVVGTPIGNLKDLSPRAIEVLDAADVILCEDTRVTAKLAARFGITTQRRSFHAHTRKEMLNKICNEILDGAAFALVSDAGMPTISDPGTELITACRDMNLRVSVVPGPTALSSAIALAGLRTDTVLYLGFLPRKGRAREQRLEEIASTPHAVVLYESPKRIHTLLHDLQPKLGQRKLALVREITKVYEETRRGTVTTLLDSIPNEVRGEHVIVIESQDDAGQEARDEHAAKWVRIMREEGLRSKTIAKILSRMKVLSKSRAYSMAENGDSNS